MSKTATFDLLMQFQDEVFQEWMAAVRSDIERAKSLPDSVLINTLPMFYKHLAALVSHDKQSTYDRSTLGIEHGRERARMTTMEIQALAHEFKLFRHTVFQVWTRHGVDISMPELLIINREIDDAIGDSIAGFVIKEAAYREQFFAALTHDLRTPLATASMAVDLIHQTKSIERTCQLAVIVGKQHALMARMIDDLLETMSLKAGEKVELEFVEVELFSLTQEVTENAKLTSGRAIDLLGKPIDGYWSRQALRRAIENLINNAIKYSYAGSPITIEIESIDSRVMLTVKNLGQPIPPEQVEGLFQIFRRGVHDSGTASWGVGLAYVRSVVEQHGGSVVVASNATETCFGLDIPRDPRLLSIHSEH